ncbi:hypothetical protein Zmor_021101 [Zophobas morio]|uniref:Uncharacterized protein n=1 Tax=Zophobas morio TaxID=2755281 RepID=A0AA38I5D1_9CUCU|nr:hypothetical protein Zmor_021101 [Zophobas morio]
MKLIIIRHDLVKLLTPHRNENKSQLAGNAVLQVLATKRSFPASYPNPLSPHQSQPRQKTFAAPSCRAPRVTLLSRKTARHPDVTRIQSAPSPKAVLLSPTFLQPGFLLSHRPEVFGDGLALARLTVDLVREKREM